LYYAQTYTEWHFIDNVNLIFHEAGHSIFFWAGEFFDMAAGTLLQLSIPLFISLYFFAHRQNISGALCLLWVGQNLLNVSAYAGDAIVMQMDLLGGDLVTHDWNYLLSMTGNLEHTPAIATAFYTLGIIFIIVGTILSMYFAWTTEATKPYRQVI
jgi:hypothetical protein